VSWRLFLLPDRAAARVAIVPAPLDRPGGLACVLSVVAVTAWIPEIARYRAHRDAPTI